MSEKIYRATHNGILEIGDITLECHVLEDERRVFTSRDLIKVFNLGNGEIDPKHNTTILTRFLRKIQLNSISNEEMTNPLINPIHFRIANGPGLPIKGYMAELLPEMCNAVLKMSTDHWLPEEMRDAAKRSRKLMNSFAKVGIIALVDEATGYQEIRDRKALQKILDQYLRKEQAEWAKRFPDEFYKEMFRLKGWEWRGMKVNRPSVVGNYTKNIVYARLAPGILAELERLNPTQENGQRKAKHHQWLTDDIGHPALNQHIFGVLVLMRASVDWKQFQRSLTRAFPVKGEQGLLPLEEE